MTINGRFREQVMCKPLKFTVEKSKQYLRCTMS